MDSIDDKHRKPRRFKGTPAYKLRNQFIVVSIVYSLVAGGLLMFSPLTREVREDPIISRARRLELEDDSEEERKRDESMILAYYQLQQSRKVREEAEKSNPADNN